MMEKVQRFGSAMLAPVLIFAFAGLAVGLSIIALNEDLVGGIAAEGSWWWSFWTVWQSGAWTVFNQMELLFVLGLPIALAKTANARAVLEAAMVYLTFQYFLSSILEHFGDKLGVDFSAEVGGTSGLKEIAGIKTLDTGIFGAIIISAIVVWLHNRYFNTKLPDFLGIFQGTQYVYALGFFLMIPVALLTAFIWPSIQSGIASMQGFFISSGVFGVWLYTFMERILIPTGLHHFIYTPFVFGPAVVPDGITKYWVAHLNEYAASTESLKDLFPSGGFSLHGNSKVFAPIGIAAAFYTTARPERRKETLTLLVPVCLTAILIGITEPLEFTFLFAAPILFVVHALLAATMAAVMYSFGVVGNMGGGLIDFVFQNWVPLWANHHATYIAQILIGLSFTAIYFLLFRFLILKLDLKTPGREADGADVKLYSKKEYREMQAAKKAEKKGSTDTGAEAVADDPYSQRARDFLALLGGAANITDVNNCATRLRVSVDDAALVSDNDADFKDAGAMGIVRKGRAFQVIVGMDVPQVRDAFEAMVTSDSPA
ncbi:alpha-glucoside-specific PTS transporter subunit IIBC [Corynebacterium sp. TAE3-ERU2]|uniref:alpha-glucoside-specific PTS transporter subunit IIBC n=1 Tax=Corynebacterium sp. TAE3-ERU2 TaxID=2849497 RepID=UPI001C446969|nr:alpha-glucoside-specific PTS transporter subunit IIBC [Corynebacterium sp. TAE3-ERU2]MBV7302618.1 alpha-glucoside-specific PTS transporter subunit IIBC [Corynebacterium sp. TAE3-ERU2]